MGLKNIEKNMLRLLHNRFVLADDLPNYVQRAYKNEFYNLRP